MRIARSAPRANFQPEPGVAVACGISGCALYSERFRPMTGFASRSKTKSEIDLKPSRYRETAANPCAVVVGTPLDPTRAAAPSPHNHAA
jgi:hypothetical protein